MVLQMSWIKKLSQGIFIRNEGVMVCLDAQPLIIDGLTPPTAHVISACLLAVARYEAVKSHQSDLALNYVTSVTVVCLL